jgi:hypothetical protein
MRFSILQGEWSGLQVTDYHGDLPWTTLLVGLDERQCHINVIARCV